MKTLNLFFVGSLALAASELSHAGLVVDENATPFQNPANNHSQRPASEILPANKGQLLDEDFKLDFSKIPPLPKDKLVVRRAIAAHRDKCPCWPSKTNRERGIIGSTIPENMEMKILSGSYGNNKTYRLITGSRWGQGKKLPPLYRTGYSSSTNSPQGSWQAGWAAINRKKDGEGGTSGIANLGDGSLDNPITVAISPALARDYGVCQGDLIYDTHQAKWGRVEGGCTSSFGKRDKPLRIDWWKGDASKLSLTLFTKTTNSFFHFPAGIVNKEYAERNGMKGIPKKP